MSKPERIHRDHIESASMVPVQPNTWRLEWHTGHDGRFEGQEIESGFVVLDLDYGPIGTVSGASLMDEPRCWELWTGNHHDERRQALQVFEARCREAAK